MQRKKSELDVVRNIAMELPDVEERTLHGAKSWKLRGKLLTCPAIHKSAEPNSLMVKIAPSERDRLLCTEPGTYYVTDHYRGVPVVLVRLSEVGRASLQVLLKKAWLFVSESGNSSERKAGKQKVSRPLQGESKK